MIPLINIIQRRNRVLTVVDRMSLGFTNIIYQWLTVWYLKKKYIGKEICLKTPPEASEDCTMNASCDIMVNPETVIDVRRPSKEELKINSQIQAVIIYSQKGKPGRFYYYPETQIFK